MPRPDATVKAETPGRLTVLVRTLREANDDLARAIACRAYAAW